MSDTSASVSDPSQCVKQVAPLPVCRSTIRWQVVASSDPRIDTEPSLGVVTANSLCWTYRSPLGSTIWVGWLLRSFAFSSRCGWARITPPVSRVRSIRSPLISSGMAGNAQGGRRPLRASSAGPRWTKSGTAARSAGKSRRESQILHLVKFCRASFCKWPCCWRHKSERAEKGSFQRAFSLPWLWEGYFCARRETTISDGNYCLMHRNNSKDN